MDKKENIDFEQIMLFKAGTFNNVETTEEHLNDMVAFAQDHPNIYADLKMDHIDDKEKRDTKFKVFENFPYSLGKIKNLAVKAGKLFGDYINVFEPVKNSLKDKLITTHSAEIYYNVTSKKTGKKYKAVLGAVALLPAGKLPALMEVFEPYMYELGFNSSDFIFDKKVLCEFSERENFMNKEQYEKMVMAYGGKKKSFEEFEAMPEDEKDGYLKSMKDMIDEKKEMMQEKKEKQKGVFAMEQEKMTADLQAVIERNQELERRLNSLAEVESKRTELLEAKLQEYERKIKSERVEKVLFSLIRSEQPKLLPAHEIKAKALLMSADDNKKVNYSIDGNNIEKSFFELAVDLLESLPEIKQSYSEKSIVAKGENVSVSSDEVEPGMDVNTLLAAKSVAKKYENDKDISKLSEAELLKVYAAEGLI